MRADQQTAGSILKPLTCLSALFWALSDDPAAGKLKRPTSISACRPAGASAGPEPSPPSSAATSVDYLKTLRASPTLTATRLGFQPSLVVHVDIGSRDWRSIAGAMLVGHRVSDDFVDLVFSGGHLFAVSVPASTAKSALWLATPPDVQHHADISVQVIEGSPPSRKDTTEGRTVTIDYVCPYDLFPRLVNR